MVIEVAQDMVDLYFMVCVCSWVAVALSALALVICELLKFFYLRKHAVAVAVNKSDDGHPCIEVSVEGNPELREIASEIAFGIVHEKEKQELTDEASEEINKQEVE